MSRRSAILCASGVFAIAVAYFATSIDWYAYGDAVPPATPATISDDRVQTLHWSAGDTVAAAEHSAPAGEKFKVAGQIDLEVDRWWWNLTPARVGSFNSADWTRYSQAQAHKPVPLLRAELVSRSSLNSGESVAVRHPLNLRPVGRTAASFSADVRAPARPGEYELRLIFGVKGVRQPFKAKWDDERVIASQQFRVQARGTAAQ